VAREEKPDQRAKAAAKTIRALAVDDNPSMAQLIAKCLSIVPGVTVVGIAFSAESALERADSLVPDLVLTDLDMPGISGLQLTGLLRQRFPAVRVIITSVHENGQWRQTALQAGADAFINKRCLADELPEAVERMFGRNGMKSR
jgi:DNA-binding NarL/FixJ family response regulator